MPTVIVEGNEVELKESPQDTALEIRPYEGEMFIEVTDECCLITARGDGKRILVDSLTLN